MVANQLKPSTQNDFNIPSHTLTCSPRPDRGKLSKLKGPAHVILILLMSIDDGIRANLIVD